MFSLDCQQYLRQAGKNYELSNYLIKYCANKCFYNWVFIALYHSAMHYFYTLLSYRGDPVPTIHLSRNLYDLGDVELARDKFYTHKNDISESVGDDYAQLFTWCNDVRYRPARARVLGNSELKIALSILQRIKLIIANEIGYTIVKNPKCEKDIALKRVNVQYIKDLQAEINTRGTAAA